MPYKLIVSDLDGTFLDDKSEIPENNRKALKIMMDKGVGFAFASGRSYQSLDYFYDALPLKGRGVCGISFNGSVIYEIDTFKRIRTVLLNNGVMRDLVSKMRPFLKDIYVYDGEGALYCEYETETFIAYAVRSRIPYVIGSLDEIKSDVIKILLMDSPEVLTSVHDHFLNIVPGVCNMFPSSKKMLEFTDLNATKGKALKYLGAHHGIDISEIIAVGDNYNDESMVIEAGLGIVTANGEDSLKKRAGYVTKASNNDGALMEIVEKYL